jgi:putative flavoprotein involved in K+ transport
MKDVHTVVVGGGVAGLAVTRCLLERGVETVLLDENEQVGHSWRTRYDSLRLNSVRWLSHMPGMPMPKSYGRWVSRDNLVDYIDRYAGPVRPSLRNGVRVEAVERGGPSRWLVTTSDGTYSAHNVVIATGLYREPVLPSWPGAAEFTGTVLHAAEYLRADPYDGKDVVVVGPGVSGVEVAVDMLKRPSGTLTVAVRTPPNFLPRELWNIPLQGLSVSNQFAPTFMQDLGGRLIQWLSVGNLADTPLGVSKEGMFTRLARTGVNPAVDDGVFVPAVRDGRIKVVDAVVDLTADGVLTASGKRVPADVVVAATGYRTGLDRVLKVDGVLGERGIPPQYGPDNARWARAGLHFVGFASPLTGHLREIGILAKKAAKVIARSSAPVPGALVKT